MAFRRKTTIINPDNDRRNPEQVKPIGILIPFNNPNGIFPLSYTTRMQMFSNLKNLLLTAKGERFFQPDFGTDIKGVLFDNITETEEFENRLRGEIESAITLWMPHLIIQSIDVKLNADELGRVDDPSHAVAIFINVLISGTNIYVPVRLFISESAELRVEELGV